MSDSCEVRLHETVEAVRAEIVGLQHDEWTCRDHEDCASVGHVEVTASEWLDSQLELVWLGRMGAGDVVWSVDGCEILVTFGGPTVRVEWSVQSPDRFLVRGWWSDDRCEAVAWSDMLGELLLSVSEAI